MRFPKMLALVPVMMLSACGNMSCSNEDAKGIVIDILKDNYAKVFGQAAFAIDADSIEVTLSAITTQTSEARKAVCVAQASFKTQKRMLPGGNEHSQIDFFYSLVKNPATVSVDYDVSLTDDGQLQVGVNNVH